MNKEIVRYCNYCEEPFNLNINNIIKYRRGSNNKVIKFFYCCNSCEKDDYYNRVSIGKKVRINND